MVASYTQLLGRRYDARLDSDAREFMAYIVDGATRMKQLIEDLLAYSRVGTRGVDFRPVSAEAALRRALYQPARGDRGGGRGGDPRPAARAAGRRGAARAAAAEPDRQRAQVPLGVGAANSCGCRRKRTRVANSRCATTASASSRSTSSASSWCSSACTTRASTPAPASASPSARRWSSATAAASGSSRALGPSGLELLFHATEARGGEPLHGREERTDRDPAGRGQPRRRAPHPGGAEGRQGLQQPALGQGRRRGDGVPAAPGQVCRRAAARHHPARPQPAEEGRPRGAARRSRTTTSLKRIPVVVLTTSKAEEDVLRTYNLHANCYVTKPVDLEKFIVVVKSIDVFWLTVSRCPERPYANGAAQRPPDRGQPGRRAPDPRR